ncbi:MAG TPA: MOSC domain-containing protein [Solirubrobacteraceae bacterium]|nr:MOSC domain-containing protein [Solirubrobacteraceae bacterium]
MSQGRVVSVNVGRTRTVEHGGRKVRTAIWKDPVAGRVAARENRLEGDRQSDGRIHGGYDKAVYAYAREDYAWWERKLGRALPPGIFGENLTTEGIDVSGARPGERWRVGTALLEVSEPRLPCFKLGIRIEDPRFPKKFGGSGRPGAYMRIVEAGDLAAGDPVEVVERPGHGVTVAQMMDARLRSDAARMARLAPATPALPDKWRRRVEKAAARIARAA